MTPPIVREHGGALVIRDDLFPGGTKARFMPVLFEGAGEAFYASPAEGGAQTALATVAKDLGKRATIFVAARAKLHPRTLEAARLGAKVVQVRPGYLSVVLARARDYAKISSARLVPFGVDLPEAITRLAALMASEIRVDPHIMETVLDKHVRRHLAELSDIYGAVRLAGCWKTVFKLLDHVLIPHGSPRGTEPFTFLVVAFVTSGVFQQPAGACPQRGQAALWQARHQGLAQAGHGD